METITHRSIAELIAIGVELERQRKHIDAQITSLAWEVENHFACARMHEEIATAHGKAVREVENKWLIDPGRINETIGLLAQNDLLIDDCITQKSEYHPTAKLRAIMCDGDSSLGLKLREYCSIDQVVRVRFCEPESEMHVDEKGALT